jgi:hypothetical protein
MIYWKSGMRNPYMDQAMDAGKVAAIAMLEAKREEFAVAGRAVLVQFGENNPAIAISTLRWPRSPRPSSTFSSSVSCCTTKNRMIINDYQNRQHLG